MSGHPDNAMICLGFFCIYLHKIAVMAEGSFILKYQKHLFQKFSGRLFRQPELDTHWEK